MPEGTVVNKNGKQYDSCDVQVNMFGTMFDEVKEITYSNEQEHQLNYSLKETATSWSKGKITPKASISIYMTDAIQIEKLGGGNLLKVKPFDVNISYVDEYNEIINDTITVKFQSQGREVKGDMGLAYQYDLFAISVKFQTQ